MAAGEGADTISYLMNATVNINGGDGYDTLFIIGTEADDFFVVTADGVYGGGRFVSFVAIELLGVDAPRATTTSPSSTRSRASPSRSTAASAATPSTSPATHPRWPPTTCRPHGLITHSIETGLCTSTPSRSTASPARRPTTTPRPSSSPVLRLRRSSARVAGPTPTRSRLPGPDDRRPDPRPHLRAHPRPVRRPERNVQVSLDGANWFRCRGDVHAGSWIPTDDLRPGRARPRRREGPDLSDPARRPRPGASGKVAHAPAEHPDRHPRRPPPPGPAPRSSSPSGAGQGEADDHLARASRHHRPRRQLGHRTECRPAPGRSAASATTTSSR